MDKKMTTTDGFRVFSEYREYPPEEMLARMPKRIRERIMRDRDAIAKRAEREAGREQAEQPKTTPGNVHSIDENELLGDLGDLDLVITADPIEELGLAYLPLFSYEAQLAVARDHELADKPWVEPADLSGEVLICYPVDRSRLDVFTSFLDPANVEPARVRNAELTTMMIQLVASGRGVACLPNWALHEYRQRDYVQVKSLGEDGVWPTLYAAVRADQAEAPFIRGFIDVAKQTCFENLVGIVTADV